MAQTLLRATSSEEPSDSDVSDPYLHFARILEGAGFRLFCAKSFRVDLAVPGLPQIPCLDHEAQLQGNPPPHVSVYLEDTARHLHEVALIPSRRRVVVDSASTIAETTDEARQQLVALLRKLFPDHKVTIQPPSLWRADRRVGQVVRAQVRLRDVLAGEEPALVRGRLERMRAVADLMEKESRVSSWGIRTLASPLLAALGVLIYKLLGLSRERFSADQVEAARVVCLTLVGGAFVYIGMMAVRLTGMATRVWKRATEYKLILDARERTTR